jgi:hypothetical protein
MKKVQMCMQNPQMLQVLIQQDPKIKKAFEVLTSDSGKNPDMEELLRSF